MGSGPINVIPDVTTSLVQQTKQKSNQPLTKKDCEKEATKHGKIEKYQNGH